MSMLKFRRGLYEQINTAPLANGTIYIATDEKAMYVDTANGRIRIGDFIRVSTVKDITPPYSTSSLYYVEADNALLKYVETEVEGVKTGTWKQVNGTDDLQNALSTLGERVTIAESKITTAEGKITALETAVGKAAEGENAATGLHLAVATNAADIAELQAAVGGVGDESLGNRITAVEGRVTTAEGDIDALQEAVSGHGATLTQHGTAISENTTAIGELETALSTHETNAAATYATKTDLNDAKTAISSEIDADVLVETNRATEAEAGLSGRIKTLEEAGYQNAGQVSSAIDTKIAAARALITTEIDEDVAALKTEVVRDYATKSALDAVDAKTIKNAADITAINNNIANNIATKTELTNSINEAKTYADSAATNAKNDAIADAATKYATIDDLETTDVNVAAAAASAKKANDDLAAYKTTAADTFATKTALSEEVAAREQAIAKEVGDRNAAIKEEADRAKEAERVLNEAVIKAQGDATQALADAATAQAAAEKAQGDINAWKTAHEGDMTNEQINAAIKVAKDAADAAQEDADTNAEAILVLQGAVTKLNGNAQTEGSVDYKVAAAKAALEDKITDEINAANSMTYKEGVGAENELPVTAEAGDTYVANGAFTASFGNVLPGDLLIATGNEVDGIIGTKDLSWTVVHTGYDATLEQTIKTVADENGENVIQLTSAVGNINNGQVAFVAAENSAATVSVADNTVTIGMAWEDF